ncbi:uncharacterized protein LOC143133523 [Alosa pseudoharengus]|uniref:uncharacterized protein LOC143133523 n=1 Tax=Alosa pseudoharengus TaxID=34774 RepID=UPI003F8C1960
MMCTVRLLILLIYYGPIVSLESEKRRLTAQVGQTVVLQPEIPNLKTNDQFLWRFHSNSGSVKSIIVQSQVLKDEVHTGYKGGFKDSLLLDRNTGSLTIRNITTSQSGLYHLQIIGDESVSDWYFNCSVYAPVSAPNITSRGNSHPNTRATTGPVGRSLSRPESQSSSSCQVLCSVKNDREVSLSWFRGDAILNQTSSSEANITLSLPLDIDDQEDTITYRCVSANPASNYTTHLSIPAVCSYKNQKDPSIRRMWYLLVPFSLCVTIVTLAVAMYLKRRKEDSNTRCEDQMVEEPHYADLKHRAHIQDVSVQETDLTCETIYAGVERQEKRDATDPQFSSATDHVSPCKVNGMRLQQREARSCVWEPLSTLPIHGANQRGPIASLESEKRRLTAQVGQTVVLQPEIPDLKTNDQFLWRFHSNSRSVKSIIVLALKDEVHTKYKGRFKDSLLLDRNTGSLTIRNITTSQSGLYHLQIMGDESVSDWYFNCSVYAPVSAPNITSRGNSHPNTRATTGPVGRSLSRPESQSSSSCQVLCSVKNDREVSLSWFRGDEILNQTSSSEANITLSLPLDIDDQEDTITYRCVSANPASNYTTHLSIPAVCSYKNQKDPSIRKLWYLFVPFSLFVTIVIVAVAMYLKKKKEDSNRRCADQTLHEVAYYVDLKHLDHTKVLHQVIFTLCVFSLGFSYCT